MNIKLKLQYDVTTHRIEEKEIEFSIEEFENYVKKYEVIIDSIHSLREEVYDFIINNDLDIPFLKDEDQIDWESFTSTFLNFEQLIPHIEYLIQKENE